jgi:hypothetical protein
MVREAMLSQVSCSISRDGRKAAHSCDMPAFLFEIHA